MVEPLTLVAVGLLVVGVVGSVTPVLPGPALSLAGVYLHWWTSGFAEPGPVALAAFTVIGLLGVGADVLSGVLGGRAGGASTTAMVAGGVVGVVGLAVVGPGGLLVGVALGVFAVEVYRHGDARRGARAASAVTAGVLASAAIQLLLTLAMLVAFLVVILV